MCWTDHMLGEKLKAAKLKAEKLRAVKLKAEMLKAGLGHQGVQPGKKPGWDLMAEERPWPDPGIGHNWWN